MDYQSYTNGFNSRSHSIDVSKNARMQNAGEMDAVDHYYSQRGMVHVHDVASVTRLSDAESRQPQIR